MKVGDIVRQNSKLLEIRTKGKENSRTEIVGVVIAMRPQSMPKAQETEWFRSWMDRLGNLVDVLWSNGNLTENFAETALDVVSEAQ
jgi:hypothetical protein